MLQKHIDLVRSVGFSPCGTRIVTGSDDNTARVWDISSLVNLKLDLNRLNLYQALILLKPEVCQEYLGNNSTIKPYYDSLSEHMKKYVLPC